jgi:hypothetical protein
MKIFKILTLAVVVLTAMPAVAVQIIDASVDSITFRMDGDIIDVAISGGVNQTSPWCSVFKNDPGGINPPMTNDQFKLYYSLILTAFTTGKTLTIEEYDAGYYNYYCGISNIRINN